MRTPLLLIAAAALLPIAVRAQAPATPAKPAAPVVPAKPVPPATPAPAGKLGGLKYFAPGQPAKPGSLNLFSVRNKQSEPRVDLDLENATVREALKQIFAQAHQEYRIEEDVPDEPRVTVHAKSVRLSTALELVLPESGVGTTLSIKDGQGSVRVFKAGGTKSPDLKPFFNALTDTFNYNLPLKPDGTVTLPDNIPDQLRRFLKAHPSLDLHAAVPYVLNLQEQRSTFRCPNCKGQSTVIRKADQPKCEKCGRTFMPDWQFCPADGTKRPAAAAEWRYCPFCGKRVEGDKNSSVPVLGDLPFIGQLFRKEPSGNALLAVPAPLIPADPLQVPLQPAPVPPAPEP